MCYYGDMNNNPIIFFNNIDKFLNAISDYDCINICFDDNVADSVINYFEEQFCKISRVIKTSFPQCYATEKLAEKIQFREEDLVVAIGGLHLQSLIKYYAYQYKLDYCLIPIHEIVEYSFSKFAFVKDDVFCFFECLPPKYVFINEKNFTKSDIVKLKNILSYKNVTMWEKEFSTDVLNAKNFDYTSIVKMINLCKDNIYSISKICANCAQKLEYTATYDFFGEDYKMLSLLALNKKSIVENLISIENTLVKFYECFLCCDVIDIEANLNIYFQKLKTIYRLNILDYMNMSLNNKIDKKQAKYRLTSFLPYLKDMFYKIVSNYNVSKINFKNNQLENALVLCSCVNLRPGILLFVRTFGYFENIVKDLIV